MRGFLYILGVIVSVSVVVSLWPGWFGRTIEIVSPPPQNTILPLFMPEEAKTFYGTLVGFPQMYEFSTLETLHLEVSILVPSTKLSRTNVSGIIFRINKDGSASDVMRLRAREARWESVRDWFGGDVYKQGGSFSADIEPGLYRIEVSTPDNIGTYVLKVGHKEAPPVGYFALVRHFADIKMFLGYSSYRVLLSPIVLMPLMGTLLLSSIAFVFWKRGLVSHKE